MSDFRKRILIPVLIPLSAFTFVGGIAWGLSRILLVTTANGASVVAFVVALVVLLVAGAVASRQFRGPEIAASGLAFVGIVAGGSVLAATMGIRPLAPHAPEPSAEITASSSVTFDQPAVTVKEAAEIAIRFVNKDAAAPHNLGLQTAPTFAESPPLVEPGSALELGQSRDYVFEELEGGTYYYFCFVHPNMKGTLTVGEGGEAPAEHSPPAEPAEPSAPPSPPASPAPTGNAAPASTIDITAKDIAFDTAALNLTAGAPIAVTFRNQDDGVPHNFAISTVDLATTVFDTGIFPGVAERKDTFTAPAAGEYTFKCDVHPNMTGSVTFT